MSALHDPLSARRHSGGTTPTISPKTCDVRKELSKGENMFSDNKNDVNLNYPLEMGGPIKPHSVSNFPGLMVPFFSII